MSQLAFDLSPPLARNFDLCKVAPTPRLKVGDSVGQFTLVSWHFVERRRKWMWESRCDCGTVKDVQEYSLLVGHTVSCGCFGKQARSTRTHGHTSKVISRTYQTWRHMRNRCHAPNDDSFCRYGARGISVCDRWLHSFEDCLADMGERPSGTSLDRIDGTQGYSIDNCRWATWSQQAQNTTRAKLTMALADEIRSLHGVRSGRVVAREFGISAHGVYAIWNGKAWRT